MKPEGNCASGYHPVVAFDAELLVHLAEQPLRCPNGTATWEPINPLAGTRHGTLLRVRRCKLAPGHDGDHEPEPDVRLRIYPRTFCGEVMEDRSWVAWTPAAGDPLCPACYGLADDGEQEALAI